MGWPGVSGAGVLVAGVLAAPAPGVWGAFGVLGALGLGPFGAFGVLAAFGVLGALGVMASATGLPGAGVAGKGEAGVW